jgi:hypothetical protein
MKKKYNDFPSLTELLERFYQNEKNIRMKMAQDFPIKWFEMKRYLIEKDIKWENILNNIILRIHLPIFDLETKKSVLLSYVDMNKIKLNHYIESKISDAFIESVYETNENGKEVIDIIYNNDYFEPIMILKEDGILTDISLLLQKNIFI